MPDDTHTKRLDTAVPEIIDINEELHDGEIPRITIIDYSTNEYKEYIVTSVDDCVSPPPGINVRWINIDGIWNHEVVEKIGTAFGLGPLIIEDIFTRDQQPKTECHTEYGLVVTRMFRCQNASPIISEQVSVVFGPQFVLSFQESEGDVFQPVRKRLQDEKSRLRTSGADYLAYSLIDTIVDNYFAVLDRIGDAIEVIQEKLITDPSIDTLRSLYMLKRKILDFRRYIIPMREVARQLERDFEGLFKKSMRPYLRDLYDHIIQVADHIENYREWLASMLDIYLSSVTNRLNDVIKILTIVSTVAVPPTMIASWYGMNFRYMPELEMLYAYPLVFLLSAGISITMLLIFKKRGWF